MRPFTRLAATLVGLVLLIAGGLTIPVQGDLNGAGLAPVITQQFGYSSPLSGGTEIALRVINLTPGTVVSVGDAQVIDPTFEGDLIVFVVPPQKTPGTRPITIRTANGMDQSTIEIVPPDFSSIAACDITTIAGGLSRVGDGNSGSRTVARISPYGLAIDANRSLVVADPRQHRVRLVPRTGGEIYTMAGTGIRGRPVDGQLAVTQPLDEPRGVAVAANGDIFVADVALNSVFRIDGLTGVIALYAGVGTEESTGDGGSATSAGIGHPNDLALGPDSALYIAELGGWRVRRVDPVSGVITTVAGGAECDSYPSVEHLGEGGPATAACLLPSGIDVDASGNLFVADLFNALVRRVDGATGIITTVAGTLEPPDPNAFEGPALEIGLQDVAEVAVNDEGVVYFTTGFEGGGDVVGGGELFQVDLHTGLLSRVEDTGSYSFAPGLAIDDASNVYVARYTDAAVRVLSSSSDLFSGYVQGVEFELPYPDSGIATEARFGRVLDVLEAPDGTFVAVTKHYFSTYSLRAIDLAAGTIVELAHSPITEVAGEAEGAAIGRKGAIFVAENVQGFDSFLRRYTGNPLASENVGGLGSRTPALGLPLRKVDLRDVVDVATDSKGDVYLSTSFGVIRISAAGLRIKRIYGFAGRIAFSRTDKLYISAHTRVLARSKHGDVHVAGNGSMEVTGDDGPATLAGLGVVRDIALDRYGNLFILAENRVRRVDVVSGIITTVAGTGAIGFDGDGRPAREAAIGDAARIVVGQDDTLFIGTSTGFVRAVNLGCL